VHFVEQLHYTDKLTVAVRRTPNECLVDDGVGLCKVLDFFLDAQGLWVVFVALFLEKRVV
jgi:hypothetical protein